LYWEVDFIICEHYTYIMTDIEEIIRELSKFTDDRDWNQFHNTKDLALE